MLFVLKTLRKYILNSQMMWGERKVFDQKHSLFCSVLVCTTDSCIAAILQTHEHNQLAVGHCNSQTLQCHVVLQNQDLAMIRDCTL